MVLLCPRTVGAGPVPLSLLATTSAVPLKDHTPSCSSGPMGLLNSIEGWAWDQQQNNRIFFPGRLHLSVTTRKTDGSHWGCFSKGSVQKGHCREFLTVPWRGSNACPSTALVTQQFHGIRNYQNSSYKVLTCLSQKELVSIANNHWAPT